LLRLYPPRRGHSNGYNVPTTLFTHIQWPKTQHQIGPTHARNMFETRYQTNARCGLKLDMQLETAAARRLERHKHTRLKHNGVFVRHIQSMSKTHVLGPKRIKLRSETVANVCETSKYSRNVSTATGCCMGTMQAGGGGYCGPFRPATHSSDYRD
jgi:hypothetical protein